ncbi:hypothetical protein [Bifidobacterium biavatii]|uniref:XRE family transcriptional regulator n=1 Tax=Bifidobacterium biavatii DSM 23969 TaxID=1437608 RepID=A0A086ZUH9_9BIFI|nr:hypothetical protein [Bifidobacterium biavatii]KFI50179.1 XRE family transcriptional regulator [Bifidobacterium biavatii DSM 23969]
MSNMKRWLRERGISYKRLGNALHLSDVSINNKVNGYVPWQYADLVQLREKYGLSSDFVNDFIDYDEYFDHQAAEHEGVLA